MIVTCKACQKRYLIEKEDIGNDGRHVRCIACGHSWQQSPLNETLNIILPKPTTFDPGYTAEIHRTKRFHWIIFPIALLSMLLILYLGRGFFVTHWPQTEKIFHAFKISVNYPYEGLSLENVVPLQIERADGKMYVLKGEIVNEGEKASALPILEILAQGDCKYATSLSRFHRLMRYIKGKILGHTCPLDSLCLLETWSHHLTENHIFPGERVTFETPARLTMTGVTDISIEF